MPVPCPRTLAIACASIAAAWPLATLAQASGPGPAAATPLQLRPSWQLQETLPADARSRQPTYLSGERASGRPNLETVLEGNAELRRGDTVIRADRIEHYAPEDQAKASGNVRINRAGSVYAGPLLDLKLDAGEGYFLNPSYRLLGGGHGQASRIDFLDEQRSVVSNASYTTCRREPGLDWLPAWLLRANSIRLDNEEDVGTASNAVLSFQGLPILPVPYLTFPLSGQRKSGFLPPTLGADSVNGFEATLPYYWNIAPNRDAKLTPTVLTKRGLDLGGEFRFLESNYSGELRGSTLPGDALRNADRWSFGSRYEGLHGLGSLGNVGLNLSINRVSDDNYWKDFARETTGLTQRLLANEASASWAQGPLSLQVKALKWQTLQDLADPNTPITPPYDRLPQLVARYSLAQPSGLQFSLDADHTRFEANSRLTGQPNAKRSFALAQLSRTWRTPGMYFTPKLQWHGSNYEFDTPLANGAWTASRSVPTLSLDGGLVFERDASFFDRAVLQTLEPRAFYVRTPFVNQSLLPIYDTAANDFNFASIFIENAFTGNDRIADNNLLTVGLTSRLLDGGSGAELAKFAIAQRWRFEDQNVTLPGGTPAAERFSDVLLGAAVNWDSKWAFDTTYQFNPQTRESTRSTMGARYSPGAYRVLNGAYRFQRGSSEQFDLSWQWPLADLWGDPGRAVAGQGLGEGRWYSVGRLNWSLADNKLVDAVLGFEYDAGCWLGRIVLEQLQVGTGQTNQRIMFQLEFVGFARLGANPLKSLKDNIPRYQLLREQTSPPSRFTNFE
jgi:LPS-assembly protein